MWAEPQVSVDVFKVHVLVYTEPSWKGNQIYGDWRQKLFSSEHDASSRLVTFLGKQNREMTASLNMVQSA